MNFKNSKKRVWGSKEGPEKAQPRCVWETVKGWGQIASYFDCSLLLPWLPLQVLWLYGVAGGGSELKEIRMNQVAVRYINPAPLWLHDKWSSYMWSSGIPLPKRVVCMLDGFSVVRLMVIVWSVGHKAPLSMGFSSKNTGLGSHLLL